MLPTISAKKLVKALDNFHFDQEIKIMEVCGTHTHSIAKSGIKQLLPKNVSLISGPGCPVCVTPTGRIDDFLNLSLKEDLIITTYGDMIRVPGSIRGFDLRQTKALGADVRMVYSPMDAVEIAINTPNKQVVFLGVGFETTAPGTAMAIESAKEQNINNFSVFSMLKTVEPALRALINSSGFDIDGFLCPGHVATIIGANNFYFLPDEFLKPSVISGFEPEDILTSLIMLLTQIVKNEPKLENEYLRGVRNEGNQSAKDEIEKIFCKCDSEWRGLGLIPMSGLSIRNEYSDFDAAVRYDLGNLKSEEPKGCKCGEIIMGKRSPIDCPLFSEICTPDDPVGPCMVSSEGACAAAYKYGSYN